MGKGEQTRDQILGKALDAASLHGLHGLTIGNLAQALGLSKSGLFAHFQSKETLQLQVLEAAKAQFVDVVVRPALLKPRGEPRIRELFRRWLAWGMKDGPQGGCIFVAAASEVDDRPGALRDAVRSSQVEWTGTLARAAQLAVAEGHFRSDLDCEQFAFELYSILLGRHLYSRLLRHDDAPERTQRAFEDLLTRSRTA